MSSGIDTSDYMFREGEECLVIPVNNHLLMGLGKITIPLVILIFTLKIIISKNLNKDFSWDSEENCCVIKWYKFKSAVDNIAIKIGIKEDTRSYSEIFVNLIIIWLFFGQAAAGLTSILYTKSDKKFMQALKRQDVDELSVYMPRFIFDEFIAVPIRYIKWDDFYNWMKNKFPQMSEGSIVNSENKFDVPYILFRGISWSFNIIISISIAAGLIGLMNYYLLDWSPLVIATIWIQDLEYSCVTKFLVTLLVRFIWEYIQVYVSNYVLHDPTLVKEWLKKFMNYFKCDWCKSNNNGFMPLV
tara:strand:+ start:304 stop:1203 length:900 start_codon:yes stop_codon:yes gene_type:complete